MQKAKSTFRKAKANEKLEKTNSFAVEVGLRLRLLKSTCATGVGLGATVSVDLCHRSGLEYLIHSDPRYDCRQSGLEDAIEVDLCIWAMDFRPKV
jgi:hypothetical protein